MCVRAGAGSHRLPLMERANQTAAFDVVRIRVSSGNRWRERRGRASISRVDAVDD